MDVNRILAEFEEELSETEGGRGLLVLKAAVLAKSGF